MTDNQKQNKSSKTQTEQSAPKDSPQSKAELKESENAKQPDSVKPVEAKTSEEEQKTASAKPAEEAEAKEPEGKKEKETGATESKEPEQTQKTEPQESKDRSSQVEVQQTDTPVKLEGLFAFKMSMSTFYNEKGESVPVTALKYEPCHISQIKTQPKESYEAVQVAFKAQKNKRCSKALIGHLKASGFKEGARFVREIRQKIPEQLKPGQEVSIESLKKGDLVKVTSLSKGRGFAGVMKRWNFAGGRASHGSKSHRRTGSIGQHTEPARVMPGRKMPGQYGFKPVSRLKVPVVDVFPEEGIIFIKGPVPGARNTLVSLRKMPSLSS